VIVNYSNNYHENIVNNVYASNHVYGTINTEIIMKNNQFYNVSGLQGAAFCVVSDECTIENEVYADSADFGFDTYAILDTNRVNVKNVTTRNVNGTNDDTKFFFYFRINDGGNLTIDTIYFLDLTVGKQKGVFIDGTMNEFIMRNFHFENIFISTHNTLIDTGSFSKIDFSNATFTTIQNETPDDQENFMISVTEIKLDNSQDCIIENVTITDSNVGFILFNSVSGVTDSSVTFTVKDIYYKDCYFEFIRHLNEFYAMESTQDLTFIFDNLQVSNLTFNRFGFIFHFEMQVANGAIVKNSKFEHIHSGMIVINSGNRENKDINARVLMQNVTFERLEENQYSAIIVNEGGELVVENGTFSKISSFEEGGVIYMGYQKASATVKSSTFTNNTSVNGGVFFVESESVLKVYD
jgi:hypothetical protein